MSTKQEIINRCLRRVSAIGQTTVTLYVFGIPYTLEQSLAQDMTNELELAYAAPVQYSEFPLNLKEEYFISISITELCNYNVNTKFNSDSESGQNNSYVLGKILSDKLLNNKIMRVFNVIWEEAVTIHEGRY